MKVPLVDVKKENDIIRDEIDKAISDVIDSSQFILGDAVSDFEQKFSLFCESGFCVGTSSGTSALHTALASLDIEYGDEIITVPNTFIATTEVISLIGGKIRFVDVDYETGLISIEKLKETISKKTKAIIPVHLYGQMCNMKAISEIAYDYDCIVIEDACQAHGSERDWCKPGYYSDIAVYSFFPAKNLGCFGDAGALTTNAKITYNYAKALVNHGRQSKYIHDFEGHNYRIDTIQSAVLNVKLKYLAERNKKRIENAEYYNEHLSEFNPIEQDKNSKSSYYMYVIRHKKRHDLSLFLKSKGIGTGVHYPLPLHLQPCYHYLKHREGDFPNTEKLSEEILSIPVYPEMSSKQREYVVDTLKKFGEK